MKLLKLTEDHEMMSFHQSSENKKNPCLPKDFESFDYKAAMTCDTEFEECLPLCKEEKYLVTSTEGLIDKALLSTRFNNSAIELPR